MAAVFGNVYILMNSPSGQKVEKIGNKNHSDLD